MTIDELLASYDPKDLEFEKRFRHEKIPKRKTPEHLLSFIPTKQEVYKILLEPLEKMMRSDNE